MFGLFDADMRQFKNYLNYQDGETLLSLVFIHGVDMGYDLLGLFMHGMDMWYGIIIRIH